MLILSLYILMTIIVVIGVPLFISIREERRDIALQAQLLEVSRTMNELIMTLTTEINDLDKRLVGIEIATVKERSD